MDPRGEGRRRSGAGRAVVLALLAAGTVLLTGCSAITGLVDQGVSAVEGAGGGSGSGGGAGSESSGSGDQETAAATGEDAELAPAVEHTGGKFTIQPPAGWTEDKDLAQDEELAFIDPGDNGDNANYLNAGLAVLVEPAEGADLEEVADGLRNLDGEILADEPVTLSDGTKAHLITSTYTDSGYEWQSTEVFTVQDDEIITASAIVVDSALEDYGPISEASVRSLTLAG